jgi:AraC-like DNA-binding protein
LTIAESELAPIETAQRLPCVLLQPYIARYAGFRLRSSLPISTRALPSRYVTLIIGWGSPFRIAGAGTFASFVAGLDEAPTTVASASVEAVHLFLHPLGTRALLGVPSHVLVRNVVHLRELIGARALELEERLRAAPSWTQRFDVLDRVFCEMLRERRASPELDWAWRKIMEGGGRVRVASVADRIGWSRRHFTARFKSELGLAPKTVVRIARFERACALIKRERTALAGVAAEAGYHDQPHMTREWRSLAGCAPQVWIAEQLPFIQDYELAGLE